MNYMKILLLIVCFLFSPLFADNSPDKTELLLKFGSLETGKKAPPIGGWTIDNKILSLKKIFEDKTKNHVLITFFSTTCVPCQYGIKLLSENRNKLQEKGIDILLIAFKEEDLALKNFLKANPLTLSLIHDKQAAISEQYGISNKDAKDRVFTKLPVSFLVNSDYTLKGIFGEEGKDFIEKIIELTK